MDLPKKVGLHDDNVNALVHFASVVVVLYDWIRIRIRFRGKYDYIIWLRAVSSAFYCRWFNYEYFVVRCVACRTGVGGFCRVRGLGRIFWLFSVVDGFFPGFRGCSCSAGSWTRVLYPMVCSIPLFYLMRFINLVVLIRSVDFFHPRIRVLYFISSVWSEFLSLNYPLLGTFWYQRIIYTLRSGFVIA